MNVQEKCAICFDPLQTHQGIKTRTRSWLCRKIGIVLPHAVITLLPCEHKFHSECINDWIPTNSQCPMDRTVVERTKPVLSRPINLKDGLLKSIERNDIDEMKQFLALGIDPNDPYFAGNPPLTRALDKELWPLVDELINAGARSKKHRELFLIGSSYINGQMAERSYAKALKWLGRAANHGSVPAHTVLGWMHMQGLGTPPNPAKALKLFTLAASWGSATAQNNMGWLYRSGQAVEMDYAEAVNWYRMAAEQGLAQAQFNLGEMYCEGRGVEQNTPEAIKWLSLAADQNLAIAQRRLEELQSVNARPATNESP